MCTCVLSSHGSPKPEHHRAAHWWGRRGLRGDAFSVSMERVWSIHPACSACLSVTLTQLLSFSSLHFCDSPWHQTAVRRSDGISSCKVAASCFKSPAYCTIHHSFLGSTMTQELHKIGRSAIKIDQNAFVGTGNQSLKLRHHSSSFPSCLPTWWCAWLPLMSSDYWSLTFCTHISSFTWAAFITPGRLLRWGKFCKEYSWKVK